MMPDNMQDDVVLTGEVNFSPTDIIKFNVYLSAGLIYNYVDMT